MRHLPFPHKALFLATAMVLITSFWFRNSTFAEPKGEVFSREKTIDFQFDAKNPENVIDLKSVLGNELSRPEECEKTLMICQIDEVKINLHIVKTWRKLEIPKLSNFEFANAVSPITNDLDRLSKEETVILQEVLARRGLLKSPDGKPIEDRGFFGAITWMGLTKLAHIKHLNPKDPKFKVKLKEKANELLSKMAKEEQYVETHPLPKLEDQEPKKGDPLSADFQKYKYLGELSDTAKRIDPGVIPITGNSVDVKIDGFVNVEKISR